MTDTPQPPKRVWVNITMRSPLEPSLVGPAYEKTEDQDWYAEGTRAEYLLDTGTLRETTPCFVKYCLEGIWHCPISGDTKPCKECDGTGRRVKP